MTKIDHRSDVNRVHTALKTDRFITIFRLSFIRRHWSVKIYIKSCFTLSEHEPEKAILSLILDVFLSK